MKDLDKRDQAQLVANHASSGVLKKLLKEERFYILLITFQSKQLT